MGNKSHARYEILILGTVQDGGYPHVGCEGPCCQNAWIDLSLKKYIASIAIINHINKKYYIIDITPDIGEQLHMLYKRYSKEYCFSGIFLTHAHVGHYTGLFKLGLEMMNTKEIPLYAMPKLMSFLHNNSSTEFLFQSKNIVPHVLNNKKHLTLSEDLNISPFLVPHRNELSETVGYKIQSKLKSIIYIPDIDSWELWKENILDVIKNNDFLFLDGTFYDKNELQKRDIEKVPHPSIKESTQIFNMLPDKDKNKIYFTHLNHTNNVLRKDSEESADVLKHYFQIAYDGMKISI